MTGFDLSNNGKKSSRGYNNIMVADYSIFILIWGLYALTGLICGVFSSSRGKTNGLTPQYLPLGAFVWADAVVFGLFWVIVSVFTFLFQDGLLFLLIMSVFWGVRSLGEIIYWLNEQFSTINRNPPEKFIFLFKIFPNDSVWFINQIFWQCVLVVSIIFSVKLFTLWL